jgi:3'-5' exoribonuclease
MQIQPICEIIKFEGDKFTGIIVAQIQSVTRNQKGGCTVCGVEHSNEKAFKFSLFNDSNLVKEFQTLYAGQFIQLKADFKQSGQWLNVYPMELEVIDTPAPRAVKPEKQAEIDENWSLIVKTINGGTNKTLKTICGMFLREYGTEFKMAAAARGYHHAEKHGLLRHTAEMMDIAINLSNVGRYKDLNWDLVFAGILMHDSAKVFENNYDGDVQIASKGGILGGHIINGVTLVGNYFKELEGGCKDSLQHLRHMIISHHGQPDWGSPVTPLTSEAVMLHHIDNLNAKVEPTLGIEDNEEYTDEGDGVFRKYKTVVVTSLPKV